MTLEKFVNIPGNLKDAYTSAVPGTLRHVDELMNERRTHPVTPEGNNLRDLWFYTGDGLLYFMERQTPKLAITREPDNLVLRHMDDAFTQLTTTGNYHPDIQEVDTAIKSASTLVVDLTKLKLEGNGKEWQYMVVSTSDYDTLNDEQRTFAERVYGQGADFIANMQMLKDARINKTKIFVLNPKYVRDDVQNTHLGRASWLSNFDSYFHFNADGRYVSNRYALRGVRREVRP